MATSSSVTEPMAPRHLLRWRRRFAKSQLINLQRNIIAYPSVPPAYYITLHRPCQYKDIAKKQGYCRKKKNIILPDDFFHFSH